VIIEGWSQLSSEPIQVYDVPGNHFTMLNEPHVRMLAEQLRSCLEQTQVVTQRRDE
jgi:thioesterase domain-containing protein